MEPVCVEANVPRCDVILALLDVHGYDYHENVTLWVNAQCPTTRILASQSHDTVRHTDINYVMISK